MRIAIYAGTFDPITRGHEDIVRRALALADHVVVAVGHTASHAKKGLFTVEERLELIRDRTGLGLKQAKEIAEPARLALSVQSAERN